jgi:precorrin-6x reductase
MQTNGHLAAKVLVDNLDEKQLALVVGALHSLAATKELVGEVAKLQAVEYLEVARSEEDAANARATKHADDQACALAA